MIVVCFIGLTIEIFREPRVSRFLVMESAVGIYQGQYMPDTIDLHLTLWMVAFCRKKENFLSVCCCSPLWNPHCSVSRLNEP